ncbi:O-methyltransferase-domain-containing protein [Aspergillus flavus]|uniref:O-methyltransferase-domain-containing protein n=1 Tax=Aspergillus flavus (strain ATCC 200026 / FGSC A1120 / IAM 13836 / NRRL 3357 / JCM 12722 / SRRC 167) TaxID=332952 RepID=A0A7U2R1W7_ASPFN|nr:hypothetical protein AFLA_013330 [Aspergillus flavus NRRL3357]QRD93073.1 O-methyltransferase-domain-containing protein [Aspergillus flavus]
MSIENSLHSRAEALTSLITQHASGAVANISKSRSMRSTVQERDQIQVVINACQELTALLTEPYEWIANAAWGYVDSVALSLVLNLKVHRHVPRNGGTISLVELAAKTGSSVVLISRIMRQCVGAFIFDEALPQCYRHNERSLCLLHDDFSSLIDYITDDGLLTGAHLTRSLSKTAFQIPKHSGQAAFQDAFQTSKTLYEYYNAVDLRRGQRFASAMAGHYNTPLDDPIESIYPFNVLRDNALVVDIGGGKGHHSIRLAEKYEMMSFIVQDQTSVVGTVQTEDLPQSVAGRIEWQAHDLHSPQPVQGADVYILSHIMMDNQPGICANILRHASNAMRSYHSRILVHDFVDPDKGERASRFLNELDFHMLASLNCLAKPLHVWTAIFYEANPRLQLTAVYRGSKNAAVFELSLVDA